ncbi:MAG TPA: pentapeptide repeat-containing protein [Phycisphaerales bacterium]|nr:pentapeptide repeat-containing protein [Phycisphaerales bacterium]
MTEAAAIDDPSGSNPDRFAYLTHVLESLPRGTLVHLAGVSLGYTNCRYIRLQRAILDNASLYKCNFDHASLNAASLKHAWCEYTTFTHACLNSAQLQNAGLEQADLCDAQLQNVRLDNAKLEGAKARRAQMYSATMTDAIVWADLEGADLSEAHLQRANLDGGRLTNCILSNADLTNAKLSGAHLNGAYLDGACLRNATLTRAKLNMAYLRHANLDGADVRGASGLLLDENQEDRLLIEPAAKDPWSVLRRTYTGPRFFVHLLMLIAFLLPFAACTIHLSALSDAHRAIQSAIANASDLNGSSMQIQMNSILAGFEASHRPVHAILVLVGWTDGWLYCLLTITLVAYNVMRYYLTRRVSDLRDAEERARISPALIEYYGVCHPLSKKCGWRSMLDEWRDRCAIWRRAPASDDRNAAIKCETGESRWRFRVRRLVLLSPVCIIGLVRIHRAMRVLFWIAVLSFAFHAARWMMTTWVWLPIRSSDGA